MTRLLATLIVLAAVGAHAQPDKIVGSDLVASEIVPRLQTLAQREGRNVETDFSGSHAAWQALKTGQADIGLLSFAPGEAPPDETFHAVPLAWLTVVVMVSQEVALQQISFAQLAGVFGAQAGSEWKRWSDLGVTGEWASRSIVPRSLQHSPLPTADLFQHLVLRSRPLDPTLRIESNEAAMAARLSSAEGGLALAVRVPATMKGVKALAVSIETGAVAYMPTAAAIERGEYPLQWPVWLIFRRSEVRRLYPWLVLLLGDEVASALEHAGLQVTSKASRANQIFALERL